MVHMFSKQRYERIYYIYICSESYRKVCSRKERNVKRRKGEGEGKGRSEEKEREGKRKKDKKGRDRWL